jgi:hypothetical protein
MASDPRSTVGEDLASWLDDAARVLRHADEARRHTSSETYPQGSPAIADLNHILGIREDRDLAERIIWLTNMWMTVGGAHLAGLAALCEARDVVFALAPLARSAFEYSNRTVWILSEGLTPEQRLARVLLEELRGALEGCRIASHFAGSGSDHHKAARRALTDQRSEILRIFPDAAVGGAPRDWSVSGEHFASPTETVVNYGGRWGDEREWTGVYDLLSGQAHPSTHVAEFFTSDADGSPVTTTDRELVEKTLRMAVVPFHHALLHLRAYSGWAAEPIDAWERELHQVFDRPKK